MLEEAARPPLGYARAMIAGALAYPFTGIGGTSISNNAQRYHGDGLKLLVHPRTERAARR